MNIFTTENLSFENFLNYGNIKISSEGVSFILGKSGSGKSTLLKLLNATLSPSSGEIYFNERNIKTIDKLELRKNIILTNQRLYLFKGNIKDNFVTYYNYLNRKLPDDSYIENCLNICQIEFSLDKSTENLSGGEKQRIFNAIALSLNPEVLMLDEPTSALDYKTSVKFFNDIILYSKEKNIKLIVITHEDELVENFADEKIFIGKSDIDE